MAKRSEENQTDSTPEASTPASGEAAKVTPDQATPQQAQVKIDESDVTACYANFCRVSGTPEELIVDFGLNPQPMGPPPETLKISQRIILNFFTAKRLLAALQMSVQRHEQAFGVLETDVRKRVRTQSS